MNIGKKSIIEEIKYIGEIDFKEINPELPRQKINGIYQYRNSNHAVCIMSYGYVAVIEIDLNGNKDVKIKNLFKEITKNHKNSSRKYFSSHIRKRFRIFCNMLRFIFKKPR